MEDTTAIVVIIHMRGMKICADICEMISHVLIIMRLYDVADTDFPVANMIPDITGT